MNTETILEYLKWNIWLEIQARLLQLSSHSTNISCFSFFYGVFFFILKISDSTIIEHTALAGEWRLLEQQPACLEIGYNSGQTTSQWWKKIEIDSLWQHPINFARIIKFEAIIRMNRHARVRTMTITAFLAPYTDTCVS